MRRLSGIAVLGGALLVAGCAGYHLGPSTGLRAGERTVFITPAVNRTLEPRLGDAVTSALRKEIQREGTFRVAGNSSADLVVNCDLTDYVRSEVSFLPGDVTTAQDYRISLVAQVVARERLSGRVVLDRSVTGNTLMRVGSDLPSAERQALPLLAADLARQISSLLTDGEW